jgi:hypothetical protein
VQAGIGPAAEFLHRVGFGFTNKLKTAAEVNEVLGLGQGTAGEVKKMKVVPWVSRADPSTMLAATETAERLIWLVRPYGSSRGSPLLSL